MVDACTIRRRTGETVDQNSGEITPTYDLVYEGKCRVQQQTATAGAEDAGEAYLLMVRLEVQLPIAVAGIEPDDEVTVTASQDPDLLDRVFTVRDLFHKTDATARRIGVVERTS